MKGVHGPQLTTPPHLFGLSGTLFLISHWVFLCSAGEEQGSILLWGYLQGVCVF